MAKIFTNTGAADKSPYKEKFWICSFHSRFIFFPHILFCSHEFFFVYFRVHASVTKNNKKF
jgi:hypothetical protein